MDKNSPDGDQTTPLPIDDPQVDPQEIMDHIRSQMIGFGAESQEGQSQFSAFPKNYPEKPDDIPYDLELYQLLDKLRQDSMATGTDLIVQDSGLSQLPVIGRLWSGLKKILHGPAHFYANRTADRQAQINLEIYQVISKLLAENQSRQREIEHLKQEIDRLSESQKG